MEDSILCHDFDSIIVEYLPDKYKILCHGVISNFVLSMVIET